MNLKAFLNPVKEENVKYAISNRFVDDEGNPVEWELKSIPSKLDEELRKACTERIVLSKNKQTKELNAMKYMDMLVVASVVEPNLNSKELQDAYGVMGAEELLKAMLKPGELIDLQQKVSEINGFDVTMDDLVNKAKN